jgi:hypothetical protein
MKQLPFLLILLLAACKSASQPKVTEQQIKDQAARIRVMEVFPELYLKTMPDSMKPWVPIFRKVNADDQRYRIDSNVAYMMLYKTEQKRLDSINLRIVDSFFTRYQRWPYEKWAGFLAQRATASVIQHAPLAKQEYYYPLMKKAYQAGEVVGWRFARLQDRINALNKRLQLYGTQFNYINNKQVLYPVADLDSLNARRQRMGLMSMEQHCKLFNLSWDFEAYKQQLPELQKTLGVYARPVE